MSRASEKLYDGITQIGDAAIEQAHARPKKRRRRALRWAGATAAVLAAAILAGVLWGRGGVDAYAIAKASYPAEQVRAEESLYAGALSGFLTAGTAAILSGDGTENRVWSPLNVYMALSMLAELTDGNSRAQLLSLLGSDTIEQQRARAGAVWNNSYYPGPRGSCRMASSLWLNEDVRFVQETMETLAKEYYASSYRGEMGSEGLNEALRDWLNAQTGGLLAEQTKSLSLKPDTVLALAATVYFRGKWDSGFNANVTAPGTFYAPDGERTCDFMYKTGLSTAYLWGERFGAVSQAFTNGWSMWYILPDEGVTPEELLTDGAFQALLTADRAGRALWENQKHLRVNLKVPKFDVVSDQELLPALAALGVTDILDWTVSDFSPITADREDIYVSQVRHAARVAVDEEGCTAVAYTEIEAPAAGEPPAEELDFTLDRPFLFLITGSDGLPLFAGVVNRP